MNIKCRNKTKTKKWYISRFEEDNVVAEDLVLACAGGDREERPPEPVCGTDGEPYMYGLAQGEVLELFRPVPPSGDRGGADSGAPEVTSGREPVTEDPGDPPAATAARHGPPAPDGSETGPPNGKVGGGAPTPERGQPGANVL